MWCFYFNYWVLFAFQWLLFFSHHMVRNHPAYISSMLTMSKLSNLIGKHVHLLIYLFTADRNDHILTLYHYHTTLPHVVFAVVENPPQNLMFCACRNAFLFTMVKSDYSNLYRFNTEFMSF